MDASLSGIDAVFLDLDGTIYLGGELIEGAEAFLGRCKDCLLYTSPSPRDS